MNVAEAHAALDELVEAAGIPVRSPGAGDPPYAFAFGDGGDLAQLLRGAYVHRWRVSLVSGAWDDRASADVLDGLVSLLMSALRSDQTGWAIAELRPVTRMPLGGGTYLACDVVVGHAVEL